MGPQNQFNGRSTQETKCKGLQNDNKERRRIELIVGQTAESWIDSRIQVKIYGTMLLHTKEEQVIIINTKLPEIELGHNKEQDVTILNWGSY